MSNNIYISGVTSTIPKELLEGRVNIEANIIGSMVNDMLQAGRNRFICLGKIRVFVDDKHKTLFFSHTGNLIKGCIKALEHRG